MAPPRDRRYGATRLPSIDADRLRSAPPTSLNNKPRQISAVLRSHQQVATFISLTHPCNALSCSAFSWQVW